jgi:hypothetical protein
MTTDNNDLGNKPHESQAAGTKIFAFKISYADGDFVGRMTGRIEATDEQHALSLAYKSAPAAPTGGKVELLKNQAAARKKPFIAMAQPKEGEFDTWFTTNYPEARVNMHWELLARNLYNASQSAWHASDAVGIVKILKFINWAEGFMTVEPEHDYDRVHNSTLEAVIYQARLQLLGDTGHD